MTTVLQPNNVSRHTQIRDVVESMLKRHSGGRYKQFTQVDSPGLIALECPDCRRQFGLPTDFVESIGEAGYLFPYFCPFCGASYTLKN